MTQKNIIFAEEMKNQCLVIIRCAFEKSTFVTSKYCQINENPFKNKYYVDSFSSCIMQLKS